MTSRFGMALFWFCNLVGLGIACLYLFFGTLGTGGDLIAAAGAAVVCFLIGSFFLFVFGGSR